MNFLRRLRKANGDKQKKKQKTKESDKAQLRRINSRVSNLEKRVNILQTQMRVIQRGG